LESAPARKPARKYKAAGNRGSRRRITPAQADRIDILQELLGWSDKGLLSFIQRQTSKNQAVDWLTGVQAGKVIVGMQRVLSGGDQALYKAINDMTNSQLKEYGAHERIND